MLRARNTDRETEWLITEMAISQNAECTRVVIWTKITDIAWAVGEAQYQFSGPYRNPRAIHMLGYCPHHHSLFCLLPWRTILLFLFSLIMIWDFNLFSCHDCSICCIIYRINIFKKHARMHFRNKQSENKRTNLIAGS